MKIPKRTISEIVTRLKKEREIREIYVEGDFDRDLYRLVLEKLEIKDVKVYPISTVDVPSELLLSKQLTSGERQRVIAAAEEVGLNEFLCSQVMFIIDSDVDHLLQRANYLPPLYGTDGTSAELIIWRRDVIRKFISLGLGCDFADRLADSIIDFVLPIVESIFLLRAAKEELGKSWVLIDIEKSFDRKTPFSFQKYCEKVGDKNGVRKEIERDLLPCIKRIKDRADSLDCSKKMHGHDLFSVFARKLCLDGFSEKIPRELDSLSRLIMASVEWDVIRDDPTIFMIKSHFQSR